MLFECTPKSTGIRCTIMLSMLKSYEPVAWKEDTGTYIFLLGNNGSIEVVESYELIGQRVLKAMGNGCVVEKYPMLAAAKKNPLAPPSKKRGASA